MLVQYTKGYACPIDPTNVQPILIPVTLNQLVWTAWYHSKEHHIQVYLFVLAEMEM